MSPRKADAYEPLSRMLRRFDRTAFDPPPGESRIRLVVDGDVSESWDALVRPDDDDVRLIRGSPRAHVDALLAADRSTWWRMSHDVRAGLDAYKSGKLKVRHNLHLAVGLLAATAPRVPGRLEVRLQMQRGKRISSLQAGTGDPVILIHGLGATKASMLPILSALSPSYRVIALDLPGFGDADKPLGAAYDAPYFARFVVEVLDSMRIKRAHIVGHSMGGRVALELGMAHAHRVQTLTLITPSLAWRRSRRWAPYLRFVRPELGYLQVMPRGIVDPVVRRMIPGADAGWTAVGVDEFMRGFSDPRGRAAFYAAARAIYLEKPTGGKGFWDRLPSVKAPALFVWGKRDPLVPAAFAPHVEHAVPDAHHLELDCAHVPQFERPRELHAAMLRFLSSHALPATTTVGALARSR